MLNEYLNRNIEENEETISKLENEIEEIGYKIQNDEKIAEAISTEIRSCSDIFSPRNHRAQNKEKLEQILEEIRGLKTERQKKQTSLESYYQKRLEYLEQTALNDTIDLRKENLSADSDFPQEEYSDEAIISALVEKDCMNTADVQNEEHTENVEDAETSGNVENIKAAGSASIAETTKPAEYLDITEPANYETDANIAEPANYVEDVNDTEPANYVEDVNDTETAKYVEGVDITKPANYVEGVDIIKPANYVEDVNIAEIINHAEDLNIIEPIYRVGDSNILESTKYVEDTSVKENKNHVENAGVAETTNPVEDSNINEAVNTKTKNIDDTENIAAYNTDSLENTILNAVSDLKNRENHGKELVHSVDANNDGSHETDTIDETELEALKKGETREWTKNVSRETFFEEAEVEQERYRAAARIADGLKLLKNDQNNIHFQEQEQAHDYIELKDDTDSREPESKEITMEVKSGELLILESERKKEIEFLEKVYRKVEKALALLNGNRNLSKKEMLQVKKMIYDYVQSIRL